MLEVDQERENGATPGRTAVDLRFASGANDETYISRAIQPLWSSAGSYAAPPLVTVGVDYAPRDATVVAHQRALIGQRFKLILDHVDGSLRLFDLELDPGELKDIAALYPEEVERMRVELEGGGIRVSE